MKCFLTSLLLFIFFGLSFGQQVETVVIHPKIVDGLHVDLAGNVYTASGGEVGGHEIGKYNLNTDSFEAYFANGFYGPIDIDQYQDSFFVVTNFDNNSVSRYNLNTGSLDVLATSLDGPAGIAISSDDNIFITNFGKGPTYSGHIINKITPEGVVSTYIDSPTLFRLQGICFNQEDVMIVHSQESLYKVNELDSSLTHWVDLGYEIGNMTFRHQDSSIYACVGGNYDRILKITSDGNVSVLSGSVSGYKDGDASTALFANPLGVAFSPNEDILYVSEAGGANRLRRIIFDQVSGLFEPENSSIQIYPNPVTDILQIHCKSEKFNVRIRNSQGAILFSKTFSLNNAVIDFQHYKHGIYFVEILKNDKRIVEKVLKM